jgi:hypothetical protein
MFRLSFVTTLLVLFMALAVLAAPSAIRAEIPTNVTISAIESRDETRTLEKRRTGKVSQDRLAVSIS